MAKAEKKSEAESLFGGREEPRLVVEHVQVEVDGAPYDIVDISISAVRVDRAGADFSKTPPERFTFVFNEAGTRYETPCTLLRQDGICAVFGYEKPTPDWAAQLNACKSFQADDLDITLWDD